MILIICTLSVFDRYDFAGKDKNVAVGLIKFDGMAWGCLFYFIAFMLSIGLAGLDFWLSIGYGIETTSTQAPVQSTTTVSPGSLLNVASTIQTWKVLVVIRCVFVCIGWLVISSDPKRSDLVFD